MLINAHIFRLTHQAEAAIKNTDLPALEAACQTLDGFVTDRPRLAKNQYRYLEFLVEKGRKAGFIYNALEKVRLAQPELAPGAEALQRQLIIGDAVPQPKATRALASQLRRAKSHEQARPIIESLFLLGQKGSEHAPAAILTALYTVQPGGMFRNPNIERRGIKLLKTAMQQFSPEERLYLSNRALKGARAELRDGLIQVMVNAAPDVEQRTAMRFLYGLSDYTGPRNRHLRRALRLYDSYAKQPASEAEIAQKPADQTTEPAVNNNQALSGFSEPKARFPMAPMNDNKADAAMRYDDLRTRIGHSFKLIENGTPTDARLTSQLLDELLDFAAEAPASLQKSSAHLVLRYTHALGALPDHEQEGRAVSLLQPTGTPTEQAEAWGKLLKPSYRNVGLRNNAYDRLMQMGKSSELPMARAAMEVVYKSEHTTPAEKATAREWFVDHRPQLAISDLPLSLQWPEMRFDTLGKTHYQKRLAAGTMPA